MIVRTGIIVCVVVALLCVACSEEKKREAARLEAMLSGDTALLADSQVAVTEMSYDSAVTDSTPVQTVATTASTETVVDSPAVSDQAVLDSPIVTAEHPPVRTESRTVDSIIPDVNAVPAENGRPAPAAMPHYIEDAYTVQVLSSTEHAYSQQIVDTFLARGYEAYLATITRDGTTYYRVRVGRYATPSQANTIAVEINRKYSMQSWVDKITK